MTRSKKGSRTNKKPKLEIKFDPEARREFLTGFHKRNLQKKAFYKTKLEKRLAVEKQRIRAEARKSVIGTSSSHSILPEVEKLIGITQCDLEDETKRKSESFNFGSKTVTISSLDSILTEPPPVEAKDSDEESSDHQPIVATANSKTIMRRTTSKLLQQSKIVKAVQRFKQKSKKSRGKKKTQTTAGSSRTDSEDSRKRKFTHGKGKSQRNQKSANQHKHSKKHR